VQTAQIDNKPLLIDWADLPSCAGCVSLENTTYSDPDVAKYINEHFVPVQLNQRENQRFFDTMKIIWTPTNTVCNSRGTELDRWTGYLPPNQFLPRIIFANARVAMAEGDWTAAIDGLSDITLTYGDSLVASEALYWLGVAQWKMTRDFDRLSDAWWRLMKEYPGSEAAAKASCL
jgi:TolA-binding protein